MLRRTRSCKGSAVSLPRWCFRDETLILCGRMLRGLSSGPLRCGLVSRPPAVKLTSRLSAIPSPLAQSVSNSTRMENVRRV
ncbi:hypothetical protein CgunFtcFv8_001428 [Champsocephalus gunnari]|uniref:Uncharacterized protein n=1 Tax=Champsocephalus gunnari TaxID=52237 RepID=A0AAN8H7N7_CHAGU|nr:hypothetical protein CgunFtcFv8_001428 [Champsocephalus gunnari]